MSRNMTAWFSQMISAKTKKALPILSFPGTQLIGASVAKIISDSDLQSQCIQRVANRCDTAASVSLMDLSVEAEAFGAGIRVPDDEVPTVIRPAVTDAASVQALAIPKVGDGRTGLYVESARKAKALITDRPMLAGAIGPFSLSGRLMDMTEIMINCIDEPDLVHALLEKTTTFLIEYVAAFKKAGLDGFVMAEPAAGLLSPEINAEFSTPYVKRIIASAQDNDFAAVYHNCGNTIPLLPSILENGARAIHLGNAIKLADALPLAPSDKVVMGNIDPAGQFRNGTPESISAATTQLLQDLGPKHPNFVISSGCDIPPLAPWANIDAFFAAVQKYYAT